MHNEPTQQRSVISGIYEPDTHKPKAYDIVRILVAATVAQAVKDARLVKDHGALKHGTGTVRMGNGIINVEGLMEFFEGGDYATCCVGLNRRIPYQEEMAELGLQEVTA